MKKMKLLFLFLVVLLCMTGCNQHDLPLEKTVTNKEQNKNGSAQSSGLLNNTEIDEHTVPTYKFMLNDKLFVDTGEIENGLKCGTMDRGFEKIIPLDEIPDENGEANFTSEYKGAQFGRRENRMVSYVDDAWHIFAYNENSFEGISMKIAEATPVKLTLEITNKVRKELIYGDSFLIEYYDKETNQWLPAEEICEYQTAFPDIAYILKPAATTTVEIDFEWLYGALEPGTYRIVKEMIDSKEPGDYEQYWYMEEFTIK